MKTKKYILLIFFVAFAVSLKAQTPQIQWTLPSEDGSYNTATKDYVARDKVTLTQGFHFQAVSGKTFRARINESLLFPADYVDLSTFTPTTGTVVGAIPGDGSVSSSGGALYSLPIELPQGLKLLGTNLSLQYNSQSGNGMLGWGWQLSGISTITRVPKTFYHDGFSRGINYSGDDFAIDGNRIISIGGVFHTENETFAKITYVSSPQYHEKWIVDTKDGLTYEYDYRIKSNMRTVQWNISKIIDLKGNYMKFNYSHAENTGQESTFNDIANIESIEFGGNGSISPSYFVKFFYEIRNDISYYFINHTESLKQERILNKIKVIVDNSLYREYGFNYAWDNPNSKLMEVTLKGSDGSQVNSTVINWNPITATSVTNTTINGFTHDFYDYITGDYNGDGKSDCFRFDKSNNSWNLYLNNNGQLVFNSSGSFANTVTFLQNTNKDYYARMNNFGDINSDGADDFVLTLKNNSTGDWEVRAFLSNAGNIINLASTSLLVCSSNAAPLEVQSGDFNGDGLTDLVIYETFTSAPKIRNVRVFSFNNTTHSYDEHSVGSMNCNILKCIDFNGNSLTDFLIYERDGNQINKFLVKEFDQTWALITIRSEWTLPNSSYPATFFITADFNGDGKTDILTANPNWCIYFSDGGYLNYVPVSLTLNGNTTVADFNNDGKSDILNYNLVHTEDEVRIPGTSPPEFDVTHEYSLKNFKILYGTGSLSTNDVFRTENLSISFILSTTIVNSTSPYTPLDFSTNLYSLGDFDGDGKIDFLNFRTGAISYASFHPFSKDLLVSKISNGLQNDVVFNYSTLTNSNCYAKTTTESYPFLVCKPALYVVKELQKSNGIGSSYSSTQFDYKDLVIHKRGKGFMGFKDITSSNENTITQSHSSITDNASYSSMNLNNSIVSNASGGLISNKNYTYGFNDLGSKCIFQYVDIINENNFEKGDINYNYDYDTDGNLIKEDVVFQGDESVNGATYTTYSGYQTYGTSPLSGVASPLSLPGLISVEKVIDGNSYTLSTSLTYNTDGLLFTKTVNNVLTTFSYDNFGNVTDIIISGGGKTITEHNAYDGKGISLIKKTNPLGYETKKNYNPYGLIIKMTDMNNLSTTYSYDGFGRIKSSSSPDGQNITYHSVC